ncbi:transposable element Tc3 transposase [Trichonephila clavipes]|nr:transposable element Tc3 transposase [Trichonephila clavipes]
MQSVTINGNEMGLEFEEWCFISVYAHQQKPSEIKEIILNVRLPKQKNRRVIFQCGDRQSIWFCLRQPSPSDSTKYVRVIWPFALTEMRSAMENEKLNNLMPLSAQNDITLELWFQQDGATCHTARATIDLLKDTFGDRLISRFGPVNWPPRSCDLTPLDYFLWGYVKSLVYADKPQSFDHLEDNICRVIADIQPQMLEKVIENWTSRLDYIRASRGSPMPEIIFKM